MVRIWVRRRKSEMAMPTSKRTFVAGFRAMLYVLREDFIKYASLFSYFGPGEVQRIGSMVEYVCRAKLCERVHPASLKLNFLIDQVINPVEAL